MPFESIFMSWESGVDIRSAADVSYPFTEDATCDASIYQANPGGFLQAYSLVEEHGKHYLAPSGTVHWGDNYADLAPAIQRVIRVLWFAQSPLCFMRKERASSSVRDGKKKVRQTSEVCFIDLRAPKCIGGGQEFSDEEIAREYRWWVRGHVRKQPVGKRGDGQHEMIWIKPFMKGPEGRPVKDSAYRVIR